MASDNPFHGIALGDAQAVHHLKSMMYLAEGLTVGGWPFVINPEMQPRRTVCLGVDHPLCFTHDNEIHTTAGHFTALALPDEMRLVEDMVARVQRVLRNYYVTAVIDGFKYYVTHAGQAQAQSDLSYMTNIQERAERFADWLNHAHPLWCGPVADGELVWTVESEPWHARR